MKNLENKQKKIHFVGVGGVSMSFLAEFCRENNCLVSGSDIEKKESLKVLEKNGIKIFHKHKKHNVKKDVDLLVYSSAISENNKEIVFAKNNKIKMMSRSEFLGEISKTFENTYLIAGTHGKTTTSAMLKTIFSVSGLKPTSHIGGKIKGDKDNFYFGDKRHFIIEACEYKDNFLNLKNDYSLITNIDYDHPDYFLTSKSYLKSFVSFISRSKVCVIKEEDFKKIKPYVNEEKIKFITYGVNSTDYQVKNIKRKLKDDGFTFTVYHKQDKLGVFSISSLSRHDVFNALSVIALSFEVGIRIEDIKKGLQDFKGVSGRMEKVRENLFIDYAHHPQEIKDSISSIKNRIHKNLVVIFQPHTFSRTKKYLGDFYSVLKNENVSIFRTYSAREKKKDGVSGESLSKLLKAKYFKTKKEIFEYVENNLTKDNCILVLGAGNINNEIYSHFKEEKRLIL